jgi:Dolichyl-phosphate-mannose-protein mannosyltransferase
MNSNKRTTTSAHYFFWFICIAALALISLSVRPLFPINETRYVGVAWEMWLQKQFLVPHLNWAVYPDKPPLLFWMIHLGWAIFGVNDWWPRFIAPLFALGTVFLLSRFARALAPNKPTLALLAPSILLGMCYFAYYLTNTRFDMLVGFFTLLSLYGMLRLNQGAKRGALYLIAGIGFGILSKGPVILVFTLPMALLTPVWSTNTANKTEGYFYILIASVLGLLSPLLWALPAAKAGGQVYADAILWSQTTKRVTTYHTHLWDYVTKLPGLILPWIIWPLLWRSIGNTGRRIFTREFRFAFLAIITSFIIMSLVSQKAERYLIPMLPMMALFFAQCLDAFAEHKKLKSEWFFPALFFAMTICFFCLPFFNHKVANMHLSAWWLLPFPLMGITYAWATQKSNLLLRVDLITFITVVIVSLFFLALVRNHVEPYNVKPMATRIHALQAKGETVAFVGHYDDQYTFIGRLTRRLYPLTNNNAKAWAAAHPSAWIVREYYRRDLPDLTKANYSHPYRGKQVAVLWRAKDYPTSR